MSGRDRTVAMVVAVLAVLAAGWILVVSPERKKANTLGGEVSSAQSQLSTAESELSNARSAQSQYATAYTAIVGLGKAVPASQEVPSLIYQLEHVSNSKKVDFSSIVTNAGTSASSSSTAAAAASSAGFTAMPFTFVFAGSYFDLEHLFEGLSHFTVRKANGTLQVSGRLLTIQSVKLTPVQPGASGKGTGELTGTITATAYVLPATQGLTGGASPASPAGGSAPSSSGSSPTAPAVVQVTP